MGNLQRDVLFTVRRIRRQPVTSAIAILTLALALLAPAVSPAQIPEHDRRNTEIRHTDRHYAMRAYTRVEWEASWPVRACRRPRPPPTRGSCDRPHSSARAISPASLAAP